MNNKTAILILSLFLITITASAQTDFDPEGFKDSFSGKDLNPVINWLAGDQKIELEIVINESETRVIGIETEGANITEVQQQGFENPTINLETKAEVFKKISSAEKPLEELNNQLGEGVSFQAKGFFNNIRISVIKLIIRLGGWIS